MVVKDPRAVLCLLKLMTMRRMPSADSRQLALSQTSYLPRLVGLFAAEPVTSDQRSDIIVSNGYTPNPSVCRPSDDQNSSLGNFAKKESHGDGRQSNRGIS